MKHGAMPGLQNARVGASSIGKYSTSTRECFIKSSIRPARRSDLGYSGRCLMSIEGHSGGSKRLYMLIIRPTFLP